MLRKSAIAALVFGAIASAGLVPIKLNEAGEELRLIKISEADKGTWYTEQEKIELIANHTHFMDITDTLVFTSTIHQNLMVFEAGV